MTVCKPETQDQPESCAMPPIFRNTLALLLGLIVGSAVNMAIITVGMKVIPPPEGIDLTDMDQFAENIKLFQPANFVAPWLAHALSSLVGAFVAAKLAASHKMKFALGIGVFFLLGGIMMVWMYGGPLWFILLDLVAAYLPMAYLGSLLSEAPKHAAP